MPNTSLLVGIFMATIVLGAVGNGASAGEAGTAAGQTQLPAVDKLPVINQLPDPFLMPRVARGMRTTVVNGEVNAAMTFDGGLEIAVTGRFNKTGGLDPSKIVIKDGDEKIEADSVEKVPAKYQGRVEKLLNTVGGPRRDRER